ncbi:hypothetical protein SAMN05216569_2285 [Pseudoxanthomonas sp. CF125]|nr:hypothetical protein SAMN05216569_2285 [Pseudoxanthomonas sp. CF125]
MATLRAVALILNSVLLLGALIFLIGLGRDYGADAGDYAPGLFALATSVISLITILIQSRRMA